MRDTSIQRWVPNRWDEVVGNGRLRRYLMHELITIRQSIASTGTVPASAYKTLLVIGAARTGKSILLGLFLRSLACLELGPDMNPCRHTCGICRQWPEHLSVNGLWSRICIGRDELPVDVRVVDCAKCQGAAHLREIVEEIREWDDGLAVVFFDEAQRLRNGKADEVLLRDMETKRVLLLFATAHPGELDAMFRDRCVIIPTTLPTADELRAWLIDRCVTWQIPYEDEAIARVISRSARKPGLCMPLLTLASTDEGGLTLDLVENDWIL